MKKILCIMVTATLLFTSTTIASAKSNKDVKQNKQQNTQQQDYKHKVTKQEFKINKSPVIKYGKYIVPIKAITKGMGAKVTFDKTTAVLTVVKDINTIVINFKDKTVTVNGIADTTTTIFTTKNSKKSIVLIKYIANKLGVRVKVDKDKVIVEVPELDLPTNVTVTSVGTTVIENTLNSTSLYMTATANITPGQATGGKAELYVGSKLVATNSFIAVTASAITFTTADSTPTNAELQAAVPTGGKVSVKLYNASNQCVSSTKANPTLVVDYVTPTITAITSAIYNAASNKLYLIATGVGTIGDSVDVTKIIFYDTTFGRTYQLVNTAEVGSNGVVLNENTLEINIGSIDKLALANITSSYTILNVAAGSLLSDTAGNISANFTAIQSVPIVFAN